ncbi:hypothetical protein BH23GEM6_BH23GEM6_04390 [soil metagenome]
MKPTRTLRLEKITRHLHADELESLREWRRLSGVSEESWPLHPSAKCWLDLAVNRAVVVALRSGRARSFTAAVNFIAGDFGISSDAIRRRWQRRRAA